MLNQIKQLQNTWCRLQPLAAVVVLMACLLVVTGCHKPIANKSATSLTEIRTAYMAKDYAKAYSLGSWASRGSDEASKQGAYMAGMSAYKLDKNREAINFLTQAASSSDKSMAGDALATIGLVYAQQNNHTQAASHFLRAASRLQGQPKANAYFYAAVSQQKIGRWADARDHLSLARNESDDPAFKRQVDEQFTVTGYSLQVGAYSDVANANKAAAIWSRKVQEFRIAEPRLVPQITADGKAVTAVQVGQFSSYATALMARQDLADKSIIVVPLR